MKNDGKKCFLMSVASKMPECEDGMKHEFVVVSKPDGHFSGWHVEKCKNCGLTIEFDTGD